MSLSRIDPKLRKRIEFICEFCNKIKYFAIPYDLDESTVNNEKGIYMLNTPKEYNIICYSCGDRLEVSIPDEETKII